MSTFRIALAACFVAGVATDLLTATTIAPPAHTSACETMRRVGIIPEGSSARIVDFETIRGRVETFSCLLPGHSLDALRVRFSLPPQHEDEPRRVEVLGTQDEPEGCATDSECEAAHGVEDESAATAPESDLPPAKIHA